MCTFFAYCTYDKPDNFYMTMYICKCVRYSIVIQRPSASSAFDAYINLPVIIEANGAALALPCSLFVILLLLLKSIKRLSLCVVYGTYSVPY